LNWTEKTHDRGSCNAPVCPYCLGENDNNGHHPNMWSKSPHKCVHCGGVFLIKVEWRATWHTSPYYPDKAQIDYEEHKEIPTCLLLMWRIFRRFNSADKMTKALLKVEKETK